MPWGQGLHGGGVNTSQACGGGFPKAAVWDFKWGQRGNFHLNQPFPIKISFFPQNSDTKKQRNFLAKQKCSFKTASYEKIKCCSICRWIEFFKKIWNKPGKPGKPENSLAFGFCNIRKNNFCTRHLNVCSKLSNSIKILYYSGFPIKFYSMI